MRLALTGRSSIHLLLLASVSLPAAYGCAAEADLVPDEMLRAELGLTLEDRVYRVSITGGASELADPSVVRVEPGAYVEFVTTDWFVHEVIFDADSLRPDQWAFLERTDQVASPPLLERESRYVLTFDEAPLGRYPYAVEGNGLPARGAIVVVEPPEGSASPHDR